MKKLLNSFLVRFAIVGAFGLNTGLGSISAQSDLGTYEWNATHSGRDLSSSVFGELTTTPADLIRPAPTIWKFQVSETLPTDPPPPTFHWIYTRAPGAFQFDWDAINLDLEGPAGSWAEIGFRVQQYGCPSVYQYASRLTIPDGQSTAHLDSISMTTEVFGLFELPGREVEYIVTPLILAQKAPNSGPIPFTIEYALNYSLQWLDRAGSIPFKAVPDSINSGLAALAGLGVLAMMRRFRG